MTAAEKLEQRVTGQPDSHVPARVLRSTRAQAGPRGPWASGMFTVVRLTSVPPPP